MQNFKILSNFRRCKRAHNAMRLEPVFGPNWPSEMLENTEGTFWWEILKNWNCWTCLIQGYIIVKESKFMIKPNKRSKLGRKTACQASECRLLRVRAFFHKTVRVCHVYCNFKIGFTCRITVIFGTLKDGSLLINTLASNIFFSYRNIFQNGVDALPKIVDAFLSKSSNFHLLRIIR